MSFPRNVWARHVASALCLAGFSMLIFRDALFGGFRFIGNSDRWNQYLTFVHVFDWGLTQHRLAVWSEGIFSGFGVWAQAFSFPTPVFLLPFVTGQHDFVTLFGFVAAGLLTLTLVVTYWVLYQFCGDTVAAIAGACVYGCATYALLKLAQNDSTYLSIVLAPPLFHLVRTADAARPFRTILPLLALLAAGLWCAFLQELTYILLFLVLYAGYLWFRGNRSPLLLLSVSLLGAVALAAPRLLVELREIAATDRGKFKLQELIILPTLLRDFSRDIFGQSGRQVAAGGNPYFNPSEGDLMCASTFASLLLLSVFLRRRFVYLMHGRKVDVTFFVAYIGFTVAVMHTNLMYRLISLAYANASLLHTRISVSALLPIAVVVSGCLSQRERVSLSGRGIAAATGIAAVVLGATAYDYEAWSGTVLRAFGQHSGDFLVCQFCPVADQKLHLFVPDLLRLLVLCLLFAALRALRRLVPAFTASWHRLILAMCITGQAVWGAYMYLSGPQTKDYATPFATNDFVMARGDQFLFPTDAEISALHMRLDDGRYRSVVLCPPPGPSCADPLALLWQLRLADGYLSGVPSDYDAILPGSGREIRFSNGDNLPWGVLSLLNVRQMIVMTAPLLMNHNFDVQRDLQLVANPSHFIYPRVYFSSVVHSVTQAQAIASVKAAVAGSGGLSGPLPADYVVGPLKMNNLDASGTPKLTDSGSRVTITFPPSTRPRLVVLNERFAEGWTAAANGEDLPVYPTNVVMRGVMVPRGVATLTFTYHAFPERSGLYLAVVILLLVTTLAVLQRRLHARLAVAQHPEQ